MKERGNPIIRFLAILLVLSSLFLGFPGRVKAFLPEDIDVQPRTLNLLRGESALISFYLPKSALVTTKIFDSSHFLMATLEDHLRCPEGRHTVKWNGRDTDGVLVPPEAYYFTTKIEFDDGRHGLYNPAFSGGKDMGLISTKIDKQKREVSYHLTESARIRIRAGVQKGPLRKTILDWVPSGSGNHVVAWDGKDETGTEVIWNKEGFVLNATAFSLPPYSIIVSNSENDYIDYWTERARRSGMALMEYMRTSREAGAALVRAREVASKVLSGTSGRLSNYYLINTFINRMPEVGMSFRGDGIVSTGDVPVVKGRVSINVTLSELTRKILTEQRYEVVFYVDDVLIGEDETGYSPYTWILDTTTLTNGPHIITVNIATLSDQVGSCSRKIMVSN